MSMSTIVAIRCKWLKKGNALPPVLWVREEELKPLSESLPLSFKTEHVRRLVPEAEQVERLELLESLRAGKVEVMGFLIAPVFKYEARYATAPTLEEQAK